MKKILTKDKIKEEVLKLAQTLNRIPVCSDYGNKNNTICWCSIFKYYESSRELYNELKLYKHYKPKEIKREKKYISNDEKIIAKQKLINYLKTLDKRPTWVELNKVEGLPSMTWYNKHIENVSNILNKYFNKTLTKEDMKERYKKLKETLGRIPTRQEMSYNMRMEKKCGKWCDFIKDMGDTPVRDTYSKKKLINILKNFHTMTGKIPDSTDIIKPNSKVFQNEFGSWNNALQEAGFEVNQRTYIADDKHVCNSKMELYIDNLLNKLNIKHTKETKYPKDEKYNKHEKKRCDWKIDDTYVEYLGCLTHNDPIVRRKYRKSMNEKAMMCIENGWNFIHITPDKLINIRNDIISEFRGN
jgi:hypothetical protein